MSGALSHSPARVLQQLLSDQSVGVIPPAAGNWPITVSDLPDTPDNAITIYDTAGKLDGNSQIDGEQYEHKGVMIEVRSAANAYNTGWVKAQAIAVALDESLKLNTITVGSSVYTHYCSTRESGPIPRRDDPNSRRFLFTINLVTALRQTT